MTKTCSKCDTEKDMEEFYDHWFGVGGKRSACKECVKKERRDGYFYGRTKYKMQTVAEYQADYFQKNKEKLDDYQRKYREENREMVNRKRRAYKKRVKEQKLLTNKLLNSNL